MKGPPAFLAFDLGAESGRVVLGRLRGKPDSRTIFADRISNLLGRSLPVIHIIGGGSRNNLT
jgi:sugar (pentulose or hexulose) kinase